MQKKYSRELRSGTEKKNLPTTKHLTFYGTNPFFPHFLSFFFFWEIFPLAGAAHKEALKQQQQTRRAHRCNCSPLTRPPPPSQTIRLLHPVALAKANRENQLKNSPWKRETRGKCSRSRSRSRSRSNCLPCWRRHQKARSGAKWKQFVDTAIYTWRKNWKNVLVIKVIWNDGYNCWAHRANLQSSVFFQGVLEREPYP